VKLETDLWRDNALDSAIRWNIALGCNRACGCYYGRRFIELTKVAFRYGAAIV